MGKSKIVKRTAVAIASAFLALIILLVSTVSVVFHREISSVVSVKEVRENFYTMDCRYNYDLEKLLQTGVKTDQELVNYIVDSLFHGMVNIDVNLEDYACTTFNARQENGDYLFGRNFDYMQAPCMLVWTKPDNGYASVSMVNLEFAGYTLEYLPDNMIDSVFTLAAPYIPVDGMNEKGLCIGVLELENAPTNQNTDKSDLTTTTMIRLVLDKAATIDQAINLFRSYDLHDSAGCGYHYQITDATGASVILEYVNDEIVLNYPAQGENGVNYQTAANYYVDDSVDDPKGFGQERCAKVLKALEAKSGIIETKDAMTLLSGVSMDKEADPNGYICDTLWSAVYNSTELTVSLCTDRDYDKVYQYSVFSDTE